MSKDFYVLSIDPGLNVGLSLFAVTLNTQATTKPGIIVLLDAQTIKIENILDYISKLEVIRRKWPAEAFENLYVVQELYHGGIGGHVQSIYNQVVGYNLSFISNRKESRMIFQENLCRLHFHSLALSCKGPKIDRHTYDAIAHGLFFIQKKLGANTKDMPAMLFQL